MEQVWCSVFEDDDEALAIWRDEVLPFMNFEGFIGLIINCWREGESFSFLHSRNCPGGSILL